MCIQLYPYKQKVFQYVLFYEEINFLLCPGLDPATERLEYAGVLLSRAASMPPDSVLAMRWEAGD